MIALPVIHLFETMILLCTNLLMFFFLQKKTVNNGTVYIQNVLPGGTEFGCVCDGPGQSLAFTQDLSMSESIFCEYV